MNMLEGKTWSLDGKKLKASPMVYISGEEMTRYAMELIMNRWIRPNVDTTSWEFYDLSVMNRDRTEDLVLKQAVEAGGRIKSIFKEPTVTPSEAQKVSMGLKKAWCSPNGPMRRGWNGITISRDTIHIEGMTLGFKHPVLFDRHAVGGEYSAGWKAVGRGSVKTVFLAKDGSEVCSFVLRKDLFCSDSHETGIDCGQS
jgi:isocitrate dehydrogenase